MQRPVIIGEILFDCLPGKEVLGGAPFNVAWHLKGFGFEPLLIGRIGDDAHGQQVLEKMREWQLDTTGIQIDSNRPTTTTEVTLVNGQASYGIPLGKAFDYIDAEQALKALGDDEISLLYFGTLASRAPASLQALYALQARNQQGKNFVDLNLRAPWWNEKQNHEFLQQADWVKLSDEEVAAIAHVDQNDLSALQSAAQQLFHKYHLEALFITRGEHGAFVISQQGLYIAAAPKVIDLVDTIGAGDTFCGTAIAGKLLGWSDEVIIKRACHLAARICAQHGAVSTEKDIYKIV